MAKRYIFKFQEGDPVIDAWLSCQKRNNESFRALIYDIAKQYGAVDYLMKNSQPSTGRPKAHDILEEVGVTESTTVSDQPVNTTEVKQPVASVNKPKVSPVADTSNQQNQQQNTQQNSQQKLQRPLREVKPPVVPQPTPQPVSQPEPLVQKESFIQPDKTGRNLDEIKPVSDNQSQSQQMEPSNQPINPVFTQTESQAEIFQRISAENPDSGGTQDRSDEEVGALDDVLSLFE